MIKITRLRLFRFKHQISLSELHRHSGLSHQHISRLELCRRSRTPKGERVLADAIRSIIISRREALENLEREYEVYRGNLLQPLEVETDEL
ncbi:MAG: hypothetical protein IJD21_03665 [Oscillospiraceae bacterium]|jgi:transcriptional regulator with XRE-family HTH domain|uniref:hypothetical protein n=1 Tax=Dysosmobacter sp. TaxID=2591382 RepID=UPI0025E91B3B|nr:hypothetical protein [Oscillospiraceae bacterium]